MADVDDVQEYGRKLKNQLKLLEDADINEDDRDAIRAFVRYEDGRGTGEGTIISNLNRLRLSAERGDTNLVEAERDDIDDLMFRLKHDYDLAKSTRREYRKALRKFYIWRGEDWGKEIELGPSPSNGVDPDRLLTDDEIDDLLAAAKNPRDKATIALLADTGLRIGAVASLRVCDIDLSGQVATININESGNVKGAEGSVPATWSRGYLANWLDVHPRRDDPQSAFIHQFGDHYTPGEDDGALTYQYLSRRIKDIGERAGIDSDRLNTHNFRKSAISRWIREGLSEQIIKHRAKWVKDSSQFETYSGVTDEEMNVDIVNHYGLVDDESPASRPTLDACLQCQTPLRQSARFCPGCGAPLTAAAADEKTNVENATFESVASARGQEIDFFAEFRERFNNDPDFRERLVGDH